MKNCQGKCRVKRIFFYFLWKKSCENCWKICEKDCVKNSTWNSTWRIFPRPIFPQFFCHMKSCVKADFLWFLANFMRILTTRNQYLFGSIYLHYDLKTTGKVGMNTIWWVLRCLGAIMGFGTQGTWHVVVLTCGAGERVYIFIWHHIKNGKLH